MKTAILKFFGENTPKNWKDFSRLYVKSDNADWVLDSIRDEMKRMCNQIAIPLIEERYGPKLSQQCLFYTSKHEALQNLKSPKNRIGFPMYHGDPKNSKQDKLRYDILKLNHKKIDRIQVSHSYMYDIVLNTGIDENKVFKIPISIEMEKFPLSTKRNRKIAKKKLNIDPSCLLIGSFQKDGIGWGSGNQPKMIKGPDIFLKVMGALKDKYPELSVLLTGPARGYVKLGLEAMNIKYYHFKLKDYSDISSFYQALDLYLVASREEGGPRSILESMASGVPLVTTRVGQAMDLVENNKNGWIVDNEDTEALVHCSKLAIDMGEDLERILVNARETAKQNSYAAQEPLWRNFMKGFVDL